MLQCDNNAITDLTPLAYAPLTDLQCQHNRITDLSPLRHAPLATLLCGDNPLTDLTVLAGLPLTLLEIGNISLDGENGEAVATLPLQHLRCTLTPRALEIAARIPGLQTINGRPVASLSTHGPEQRPALLVRRGEEVEDGVVVDVTRKDRYPKHYRRGEPLQRAVVFLQAYLTEYPGAAAVDLRRRTKQSHQRDHAPAGEEIPCYYLLSIVGRREIWSMEMVSALAVIIS